MPICIDVGLHLGLVGSEYHRVQVGDCVDAGDRGQVVNDADEPENSDVEEAGGTRMLVMDKVQDVKWIQRLLAREKEIAKARQPGQTPDNCKAMLKVANVYGSLLGGILESVPVEARECLRFHSSAPLALEMQARRAEANPTAVRWRWRRR